MASMIERIRFAAVQLQKFSRINSIAFHIQPVRIHILVYPLTSYCSSSLCFFLYATNESEIGIKIREKKYVLTLVI